MLGLLDKNLLIKLHLQGLSNTAIANELKISRPTVIKYVKQYQLDQAMLEAAETIEEKEAIIIKSSENLNIMLLIERDSRLLQKSSL